MQNFAPRSSVIDGSRPVRAFLSALRHHGLLLVSAALVLAFGYAVSALTGYRIGVSLLVFVERYVVMAGVIVLSTIVIWKFTRMVLLERPQGPLREMMRWLRQDVFNKGRVLNGGFGMVVVLLLIAGFSQAKNNAVRFDTYNWDPVWLSLDRALHFSVLPQDLLWPVLGSSPVTRFVDLSYAMWYALLFASCFVGAFQSTRSLERHRFLLALIFTFGIGGSLLAILLSSVGPVYFGEIAAGPSPFAIHMARLGEIDARTPLHAIETQKMLWNAKAQQDGASLVSAMPSMHVALSALVALALWRQGWFLRIASIAFAALILLGSVHLGWHYAVDGYAGILVAAAAWTAALPISRWYLRRIGELPLD